MKSKQEITDRDLWLSHLDEAMRVHGLSTNVELADLLGVHRQEIEKFRNGNSTDLPPDSLRARIMWSIRETTAVSSRTKKFLSHLSLWDRGMTVEEMRAHWLVKLDEIKSEYDLSSDAQLAVFLGISRQALSKFRHGASSLPSVGTQAQILNLSKAADWTDQIWKLLPDKQAEAMAEANRKWATYLRLKNKAKK